MSRPLVGGPFTNGMRDIILERHRQVQEEGWTTEHDDKHKYGEISRAAACYLLVNLVGLKSFSFVLDYVNSLWPWDWNWWKPGIWRRNLVKAGALIIAEIERLDRIEGRRAR